MRHPLHAKHSQTTRTFPEPFQNHHATFSSHGPCGRNGKRTGHSLEVLRQEFRRRHQELRFNRHSLHCRARSSPRRSFLEQRGGEPVKRLLFPLLMLGVASTLPAQAGEWVILENSGPGGTVTYARHRGTWGGVSHVTEKFCLIRRSGVEKCMKEDDWVANCSAYRLITPSGGEWRKDGNIWRADLNGKAAPAGGGVQRTFNFACSR